jgi:hypothetical protein
VTTRSRTDANEAAGPGAWSVQATDAVRRWDDEEVACPACGRPVRLDGPHVGVQLVRPAADRSPGRKRTVDQRRLAFCDDDCAREWLGGTPDPEE